MYSISTKKTSTQSGFSLMEMLIAMVIFLIVTGAIYGLLRVGTLDRNRSSRRSDSLKNSRAALQLLGRDTLNAGLAYNSIGGAVPDDFLSTTLGFPADTDTDRDFLTSVITGNNVTTNPNLLAGSDMVGFVMRDVDFQFFTPGSGLGPNSISIVNQVGNGGNAALQISTTGQAVNTNVFDLFLVNDDTTRAVVMLTEKGSNGDVLNFHTTHPNDPFNLNQSVNSPQPNMVSLLRACDPPPPTNPAICMKYPSVSIKKIILVTFSVLADGTFVRTVYGGNSNTGATAADQVQVMPLAYGVQNMQITYTMRDGTLTDDPSIANRQFIRQLNVSMTVQDETADEATRQRHAVTMTGSFSAKNMEYNQ